MNKKINFKGFNLFSIIVAATLLMIGTILISTLVSTEETTSTEIYMMTSDFELSDAASLARADALQTFNYQFRKEIQNYLNYSTKMDSAGFPILDTEGDYSNFDNVVRAFERVILLADPDEPNDVNNLSLVINRISNRTIESFPEGRYGKYIVSISDTSRVAVDNTTEIILKAISDDFDSGNRFLDVVGCDAFECEIGSFYFNIPLNKIDPVVYEKLPKIVVRDITTNEEMKIPLLPRSNLKIYIPLRFFKAIHHARDNLEAIKLSEHDLTDARLGYCDTGSCVPREHPLNRTRGDWDNQCRATQNLNPGFAGVSSYDTGTSLVGSRGLISFAKEKICSRYFITPSFSDSNFINHNDRLAPDSSTPAPIPYCGFYRIGALIRSLEKKQISGTEQKLLCSEITGVNADVIFKETHPQYMVDGEEILYKIRISSRNLSSMSAGLIGECSSGSIPATCKVA